MSPPCKHLNFIVRPENSIGYGWCPDCQAEYNLAECFTNLADEMRRTIQLAKEQLDAQKRVD